MKKWRVFTTMVALFFAAACEKPLVDNEAVLESEVTKTLYWKGLETTNSIGVSSKLLLSEELNLENYYAEKVSETSKKTRGTNENKKTLREVLDKIYRKYPSFDSFNPKEYKKYFPKMSEEEIIENQDLVLSYVERLMGLDFAKTFAEQGDGKLELKKDVSRARLGDFFIWVWNTMTQCELWYYLGHLRMDESGIWAAKAKAFEQQERFYGQNAIESDRADALRHGVWTALTGKYACYRYGNISEAASVASGFAESHECNDNSIDSKMDTHNNGFSIGHYITNAQRVKVGLWNYNVQMNRTDNQIGDHAKNAQTWQRTTVNDILWTPNSVLVYINSNTLID